MTVFPVVPYSPDQCCQGNTGSLSIHHKQYRRLREPCHIIGTGLFADPGKSVIKAHDSLDHSQVTLFHFVCQDPSQSILIGKIAVQIAGRYFKHLPVEHGINIVRAAFHGSRFDLFLFAQCQQSTGK